MTASPDPTRPAADPDVVALLADALEALGDDWRFFKVHVPQGAYLPVGALDGDCRECGGSWPCAPYTDRLAAALAARGLSQGKTVTAEQAWDEAAEATAEWMANNPGPSGIPHDPPTNPYRQPVEDGGQ